MYNLYQRYTIIDGATYEIVDAERFVQNPTIWPMQRIALLFTGQYYGKTPLPDFVLPFRTDSETKPGLYGQSEKTPCSVFWWILPFVFDAFGNIISYDPQYMRDNIRDMTKAKDMREIIELDSKYKKEEFSKLAAGAEITKLTIGSGDAPETAIIKEAINAKNIDMDKYRDRFKAGTYPNDKRALMRVKEGTDDDTNSGATSLPKIRDIGAALDMRVYLIIDNANPGVVNPLPHPLMVDITNGDSSSVTMIESIPEVLYTIDDEIEVDEGGIDE